MVFIARSMLVSYSNRSPETVRKRSTALRGMARRPVWVSEMVMPQKSFITAEVVWLPKRLRLGTSGWLKSRQPKITLPVSSIRWVQRRVSSG